MQKNNFVRPIVWAMIICLSSAEMWAQSSTLMSDPLFGITYDPQKIQFEKMPSLLTERCPRLKRRYVAAWVYGHFKTTDSEYFLVSGLMESTEDSARGARTVVPEEGSGLVVALHGSACIVDQSTTSSTKASIPPRARLRLRRQHWSWKEWCKIHSIDMSPPLVDEQSS
jgi:hypothetical protein